MGGDGDAGLWNAASSFLEGTGMKSVWYTTVLYGIAVGLLLTLPACADFKKDFLCRPSGHCVNAPDGSYGPN